MKKGLNLSASPSTTPFTVNDKPKAKKTESTVVEKGREGNQLIRKQAEQAKKRRFRDEELKAESIVIESKSFTIPDGKGYLYRRKQKTYEREEKRTKTESHTDGCEEMVAEALPKKRGDSSRTASSFQLNNPSDIKGGTSVSTFVVEVKKDATTETTAEIENRCKRCDATERVLRSIDSTDAKSHLLSNEITLNGSFSLIHALLLSYMDQRRDFENLDKSRRKRKRKSRTNIGLKITKRSRLKELWSGRKAQKQRRDEEVPQGESCDELTKKTVRRQQSEPSTKNGFVWRNQNRDKLETSNSSLGHMNYDETEEFAMWEAAPEPVTGAWESALYRTGRPWSVLSMAAFRRNRISERPGEVLNILRNQNDKPMSGSVEPRLTDGETSSRQKSLDIMNWLDSLHFRGSPSGVADPSPTISAQSKSPRSSRRESKCVIADGPPTSAFRRSKGDGRRSHASKSDMATGSVRTASRSNLTFQIEQLWRFLCRGANAKEQRRPSRSMLLALLAATAVWIFASTIAVDL